MSSNYPTSLDTATELPSPTTGATIPALADANRSEAIIAVETKIGTGASTPTDGTVLKGTGTGTSAFGTVDSGDVAADLVSGQTLVTAVGADKVLILDATDGALKSSLISDFASAGGDMAAATYDPATVSEQLAGLTATQTLTNKSIDADNNTVTNIGLAEFDTDTGDAFGLLIGSALDSPSVTVASNGTVVTLSIEKSGGGDMRYLFSDGVYTLDTTPAATATLTAGSDVSPTINYVYLLQSNKTVTVSTSGWPAAEHARIGTALCQSAASLQTDGAYKTHVWTDHVKGTDNNDGHLVHLNRWIRLQPATWESGVALTPTITTNGGAEDNVDIATTSGVVLQLHDHAMPAFDTAVSSDVYVPNYNGTAYNKIQDLIQANQDDAGNAVTNNSRTNLVIWGAVNEATGDCKLFVNLPSAFHSSDNAATADVEGYSNYTIPADFTGVGFLIARLTLRYQTVSSGTWSVIENKDLRGLFPTTGAGGGGGGSGTVVFPDNTFRVQDEADTTRQIALDAGSITTANTRTITMADADIDLANVPSSAEKTVLGNTSGTNTGDQTTVSGTSGNTDALNSATTVVDVSAATAPTTGQVLTATGTTAATWQTPAGGGSSTNWSTVTRIGPETAGENNGLIFESGGTGSADPAWATDKSWKFIPSNSFGSDAFTGMRFESDLAINSSYAIFGTKFRMSAALKLTNYASNRIECFVGIISQVMNVQSDTPVTQTIKHVGVLIENAGTATPTFSASNADGTTQTKTDISSDFTAAGTNSIDVVYDGGTDIKFYANGVLAATHTTNMPTGQNSQYDLFTIYASNTGSVGGSEFSMSLSSAEFAIATS